MALRRRSRKIHSRASGLLQPPKHSRHPLCDHGRYIMSVRVPVAVGETFEQLTHLI